MNFFMQIVKFTNKFFSVNVIEDFGDLFNSNVTFAPHIDHAVSKYVDQISQLRKARSYANFTDTDALIQLYRFIIMPS